MDDYKTVLDAWASEMEIKKSRFLNFVFHVETEDQVQAILADLRKEHYKASHVCFAYVLKTRRQKFSDDGEPAGTAGKPILEVINNRDLKDVLVIVVRYFGGVKLGSGGLVRAYSCGAVEVLNQATIIEKKMVDQIRVVVDYPLYGSLINQLKELNHRPVAEKFTDKVSLTFQIPLAQTEEFLKWLTDKTSGNMEMINEGQKYKD